MVMNLKAYQRDCVDAFRMECSEKDIENNQEAKKLAKFINKMGRKIDKIERLRSKIAY